jgi:hypothetical protein
MFVADLALTVSHQTDESVLTATGADPAPVAGSPKSCSGSTPGFQACALVAWVVSEVVHDGRESPNGDRGLGAGRSANRCGRPGEHEAAADEKIQMIRTFAFGHDQVGAPPPGERVPDDSVAGNAGCAEGHQIVAQVPQLSR